MPRGRPKKVTPVNDTPKKEEVAKIHCLRCGNSTMTNFYMSRDKHKQFLVKYLIVRNVLNVYILTI